MQQAEPPTHPTTTEFPDMESADTLMNKNEILQVKVHNPLIIYLWKQYLSYGIGQVPRQEGGEACGLFVMYYVQQLLPHLDTWPPAISFNVSSTPHSALLYCCHAYHVTKLSTRILPWLAAKTDEVETLRHELITWIVSAMKPTSLAGLVGTFPHNCGGQALRQEYCRQYVSYMGLDPDAIIETQRKSHQYTSWLNAYNC